MKIVSLLTGRGNNTLKDKNILPVLGKPLLYYPAMAAKSCKMISDFYVSSDDEKILNAAAACGYRKIKRPDELALPTAQHVDAIIHAYCDANHAQRGIGVDIPRTLGLAFRYGRAAVADESTGVQMPVDPVVAPIVVCRPSLAHVQMSAPLEILCIGRKGAASQ